MRVCVASVWVRICASLWRSLSQHLMPLWRKKTWMLANKCVSVWLIFCCNRILFCLVVCVTTHSNFLKYIRRTYFTYSTLLLEKKLSFTRERRLQKQLFNLVNFLSWKEFKRYQVTKDLHLINHIQVHRKKLRDLVKKT